MNAETNKFRVTGLVSGVGTSVGVHDIAVTGTLPDSVTSSTFNFNLTPKPVRSTSLFTTSRCCQPSLLRDRCLSDLHLP